MDSLRHREWNNQNKDKKPILLRFYRNWNVVRRLRKRKRSDDYNRRIIVAAAYDWKAARAKAEKSEDMISARDNS
jgi:hypothetical protein